jgi:hypothetical protein
VKYELAAWVVAVYPNGSFELYLKRSDDSLLLQDFGDYISQDDGLVMEVILGGMEDMSSDV